MSDGDAGVLDVEDLKFLAALQWACYGPWTGPIPASAPKAPDLLECGDDEAVGVLLEATQGKYWADSWQGRLRKMREAGYVIAKVKA